MIEDRSTATSEALQARVAELEAALSAERTRADEAVAERDRLREAYRAKGAVYLPGGWRVRVRLR